MPTPPTLALEAGDAAILTVAQPLLPDGEHFPHVPRKLFARAQLSPHNSKTARQTLRTRTHLGGRRGPRPSASGGVTARTSATSRTISSMAAVRGRLQVLIRIRGRSSGSNALNARRPPCRVTVFTWDPTT